MKKTIFSFALFFLVGMLQSANAQGCLNCPQGQQLGANLITNGDFSNGNDGSFGSDLPLDNGCQMESYDVRPQASDKCINWPTGLWDHTVGNATGSYLILDGPRNATNVAPNRMWWQNVTVQGGAQYEFEFHWLPDFSGNSFASLQVFAGNTPISPVYGPIASDQWQQFCFTWTAPGSFPIGVQLSIRQVGTFDGSGYDYGIDDISFRCCEAIPPPPCEVNAKWDVKQTELCEFVFTNFSTSGAGTTIIGYHWDFGDGQTSNDPNPTHFYSSPGTYYVCLTVFGLTEEGECCTDTYCRKIENGCEQQDCKIDIRDINVKYGLSCNVGLYVDVNTNRPIIGYFWDYGDGTSGSGTNPQSHTFPSSGTYYVCVTVVAMDGEKCCTATFCRKVQVNCLEDQGGEGLVDPDLGFDIAPAAKSDLKISPNPATSEVNVEFESKVKGDYDLRVVNLQGQIVMTANGHGVMGNEKVQLDASQLSPGTYFVSVMLNGELLTEKLVIQ